MLDSARQTSGDFYDFIPLDDGLIGIVMADVSDKGTGAALYIALSRTLIRTYAMESGAKPGVALTRANERIRADTESDQFVTLIYGILDPVTGMLTYANAGHNPGYLLRAVGGAEDGQVVSLTKTGIPLGMFEGMEWQQAQVQIQPGDVLLLYTDGVTEAQNLADKEYGDNRLISIGQQNKGRPASEIQEAIHDLHRRVRRRSASIRRYHLDDRIPGCLSIMGSLTGPRLVQFWKLDQSYPYIL